MKSMQSLDKNWMCVKMMACKRRFIKTVYTIHQVLKSDFRITSGQGSSIRWFVHDENQEQFEIPYSFTTLQVILESLVRTKSSIKHIHGKMYGSTAVQCWEASGPMSTSFNIGNWKETSVKISGPCFLYYYSILFQMSLNHNQIQMR